MSPIQSSSSEGGGDAGVGQTDIVAQFVGRVLHRPDQGEIRSTDVLIAYCDGLGLVWDSLIPWIGPLGSRAVLRRAVDIAGRKWSFLHGLGMTDKGLDRECLVVALSGASCAAAEDGLSALLLQTIAILDSLAGDILVESLISKLDSYTGRVSNDPE